jgi:hypothetical protein
MSRGGAGRNTRPQVPNPRVVLRQAETVERLVYTRAQAAEALGISQATLTRRILPYIDTVVMPGGTTVIPVDELERLVAEGRRPKVKGTPPRAGRRAGVDADIRARIARERGAGHSLARIAGDLNQDRVPTTQGGSKWWASTVKTVLDRHDSAKSAGDNEDRVWPICRAPFKDEQTTPSS